MRRVQRERPIASGHEGAPQNCAPAHQIPCVKGRKETSASTPMPIIALSNSPRTSFSAWMVSLRSGRSAQAAA